MAVDDRVKFLITQEIDRVLSEAAGRPEDLHAELHALATKVASLTQTVAVLADRVASLEDRALPASARTRKTAANAS